MKIHILDPMAAAGLHYGYNRPLDRHDFDGKIPDRIGHFALAPGELRRFANMTIQGGAASGVDSFSWVTDEKHPVGTIGFDRFGGRYRFVQAGAVALVVGNTIQGPAIVANHIALTSAAQAIGDGGAGRPIVVTPGATAAAANAYAGGTLNVSVTPGLGRSYRISGHAAITASTAFNLFLDPDDLLQEAFTTSTRYGLLANPYRGVIQFPVTTATGSLVGTGVAAVAIANYGWVRTHGIGDVLITGTPALGAYVMAPGSTAGAAIILTTTNLVVAQIVGRMAQVGASGETNPVMLDID